ncbi:MAG: GNAT family N-acetyltransferase [Catenulisporales bacterium]|nr:GNAT family N-acetyltransferase [Catenulisporales bacterium]
MTDTTDAKIRTATPADAATVARLHAVSWRRHYRGAYADAYLDGDVVSDRLAVWTRRLADPEGTLTLLAEDATEALGFVHIVFDDDSTWGSLIDNLHITPDHQRTGVGRSLLTLAAQAATRQATHPGLYLWVLEQNDAAQHFYRAMGGNIVEKATVSDPGGVPGRLVGEPVKLRCAWPDVRTVTGAART